MILFEYTTDHHIERKDTIVRSIFESLLGLVMGAPHQKNNTHATQNDPLTRQVESLLRYWMDCELYDLPSIPKYSKAPESFLSEWDKFEKKLRSSKRLLNEKSRVLFMFQTHMAGYIYDGAEVGPNAEVPKTYLAGIGLQPKLNLSTQKIEWRLPEDSNDESIFNLAAMRTLYRRQKPKDAEGQTLQEWTKSRLDFLKNQFVTSFKVEKDEPGFTTEELFPLLKDVNRKLASEFWTDEHSKNYITNLAKPLNGVFSKWDEDYKSGWVKSDTPGVRLPTFRWRYSFQEDGLETVQIGPFFVKDLAECLDIVQNSGLGGLSKPLRHYLLGYQRATGCPQIQFPINPLEQYNFFKYMNSCFPRGRWPDNPEYGLSLLQCTAVCAAVNEKSKQPIVAVNGPPGTGKTTLLKEVIADAFVKRSLSLLGLYKSNPDGWYNTNECRKIILENSIVVASSNNKAVENISKELPSKAKVWGINKPEHFSDVCKDEDWGLFCAVLGNKSNRREFSGTLRKLIKHLSHIGDRFAMNVFRESVRAVETEKRGSTIERYLLKLVENGRDSDFTNDIKLLPVFRKGDLNWLVQFLECVQFGKDCTAIIGELNALDEEAWEERRQSIFSMVKQWFGAKHDERHIKERLVRVKHEADEIESRVADMMRHDSKYPMELGYKGGCYSEGDPIQKYSADEYESDEDAIKRILMSSEFGGVAQNTARSMIFVVACRINEVLVANARKAIKEDLGLVEKLLDGDTSELDSTSIEKAWSTLFLFFPVMSSSLASIQNQLDTIQEKEMFGLCMVDEAGQAINYHVVGLMQRCKQAILVGDPIQVEPVVTTPKEVDRVVAGDFLNQEVADKFCISTSSAQKIADEAGGYYSMIGDRKVGMPLLVHRRCLEPMFSIANQIAYDNKMINANDSLPEGIGSLIIDTTIAQKKQGAIEGYKNTLEAQLAVQLMEFLTRREIYIEEGVFVITPFKEMERELRRHWRELAATSKNREWMKCLLTKANREKFDTLEAEMKPSEATKILEDFAVTNIGTVHTFQGKEATTVIICLAATKKAKKAGGIAWVNKTPNILNVAVTRAKKYVHIIGNRSDWLSGAYSKTILESKLKLISISDGNKSLLDDLELSEKLAANEITNGSCFVQHSDKNEYENNLTLLPDCSEADEYINESFNDYEWVKSGILGSDIRDWEY